MELFNKKKYICCRCEKEIPTGRSRKFCGKTYCIECELFVRTNGKREAEEIVNTKLLDNKKRVCSRCGIEIPKGRSRVLSGETYCIECKINKQKEAKERERLKIIEEANKSKFYYNVEDPVEAYLFWQNEVDNAHERLNLLKISQKISWEEITKGYKYQETILIKSTPDYEHPDKVDWDWDTCLSISYNETTDEYMFSLTEYFNSTWDGFPVFCGGEISLELFEKYMKIIDNHKYDELIAELKK